MLHLPRERSMPGSGPRDMVKIGWSVFRCHMGCRTSRVFSRTLHHPARGLGAGAAGWERGLWSDHVPASIYRLALPPLPRPPLRAPQPSSVGPITADVYLRSKSSESATAATMSGFPRRTPTPSRSCPAASRSPTRYSTAARAEPFPSDKEPPRRLSRWGLDDRAAPPRGPWRPATRGEWSGEPPFLTQPHDLTLLRPAFRCRKGASSSTKDATSTL